MTPVLPLVLPLIAPMALGSGLAGRYDASGSPFTLLLRGQQVLLRGQQVTLGASK